jgi:hypothetical protein
MKTKYPRIFGLLAAVLLVASFVLPTGLVSPASVAADPGICKWDALTTPGFLPLKNDIAGSFAYDIHDMAVGGDGATVLLVAQTWLSHAVLPSQLPTNGTFNNQLYYSPNNGLSFGGTKNTAFVNAYFDYWGITTAQHLANENLYPNVWLVAIAPDNPNFWAIVTSDNVQVPGGNAPLDVWVTSNAGSRWECTQIGAILLDPLVDETIRSIDISVDYGGKRDIAIGTVDGTGNGDVYVVKSSGFGGWKAQNLAVGDFYAVKFSPSYASDAALAVVFSDNLSTGTFYNISLRDIDTNAHNTWAFPPAPGPGVKLPPTTVGISPVYTNLNKVDLELPSDFSGQAASLRRAYISLDTYNGTTKIGWDGILRVDNTSVYVLMDNSAEIRKSIYSIAYFGTYASGKLLAGERMGWPCTAEVPTWFTDSPTTCPIPCWYPALKPTTGAAGITCSDDQVGIGAALVGWKADGQLAFAATGSHAINTSTYWFGTGASPNMSWLPWWLNHLLPPYTLYANGSLVKRDESAFGISRNNGETWNQIALIDTTITQFTDIAPSSDCKTIYLASVNTNTTCSGFDSVWRTSSNIDVTSPYAPLPVGIFWERVLTRPTAPSCDDPAGQTDVALLRLVPYCADPTGEVVAWGVYDTGKKFGTGVAAWSPDFGDYWANITPRDPIQDFTFESRTVMYFLMPDGGVQKMPYTGTAWSTTLSTVDTIIYGAHTIAAYPEGKVIVGANAEYQGNLYATSFSSNFNTDNPSFAVMSTAGATAAKGDVHVAFSPNFKDNSMVFIGDEVSTVGSVYRNNPGAQLRWGDTNMLSTTNNAVGCPTPSQDGIYGIALAFTGEALYAAASGAAVVGTHNVAECGVWRTIDDGTGKYGPLSGMPKPGIAWDFLNVFVSPPASGPCFTLEPSSLKICGCCTMDTDSTLYAIDNYAYSTTYKTGYVWAFTDCLAKKGPALVTEDKTLIGCDPVSGRAQEVNLCWEQLCVADRYDIEIAKSADFSIRIIDWITEDDCGGLAPVDVTSPCAFFPAGGIAVGYWGVSDEPVASAIAAWGNLECGHTYYWRVKARECATGQDIRSPWSEVRSFTVKAGLPVVSTYLGLTLLAPNNGCLGCPIKPVSFSWSPFKETTKYKFQLASDAGMTQLVKEAEVVNSTAYEFDGALDFSTNYFWRVMSMEPAPSDWSATFSFQTEAKPAEAAGAAPVAPTPIWVWVVIAIGAILVIVTLVLIFKTRRV